MAELSVLVTTALSIIAATFMAFLGYLKRQPGESFQPEKLVATYISGLIVGLLFAVLDVPVELADELVYYFAIQSGLIVALERILKALWRRYFKDWYDSLKE